MSRPLGPVIRRQLRVRRRRSCARWLWVVRLVRLHRFQVTCPRVPASGRTWNGGLLVLQRRGIPVRAPFSLRWPRSRLAVRLGDLGRGPSCLLGGHRWAVVPRLCRGRCRWLPDAGHWWAARRQWWRCPWRAVVTHLFTRLGGWWWWWPRLSRRGWQVPGRWGSLR